MIVFVTYAVIPARRGWICRARTASGTTISSHHHTKSAALSHGDRLCNPDPATVKALALINGADR